MSFTFQVPAGSSRPARRQRYTAGMHPSPWISGPRSASPAGQPGRGRARCRRRTARPSGRRRGKTRALAGPLPRDRRSSAADRARRSGTGRAGETTEPILLLCLARPDLVERRPDWDSTDVVELEPLSTADVESLAVRRAGSIGPDVVRRIVEISEGNPLFAEQVLVALDDGPVGPVPASLGGLLTMRLDHFGTGQARPAPVLIDRRARVRIGCRVRAPSPGRHSVPGAPSQVDGAEALHPAHGPDHLPVPSRPHQDGGVSEHCP